MGQHDLIDINKDNLYDILGVQHDATAKEINRSYRKQALKLHPDKNPDPAAHKKFLKLTQILELLSDDSSRKNYDIVLKAREAARLRTQQLDCKRRKLKESLEDKERSGNGSTIVKNAEQKLQDMIKKLQAEGDSILLREEEKLRDELQEKSDFTAADQATVKIKWKCKKNSDSVCAVDHSKDNLLKILQRYGPVSDVIVNPKRKGSALAVFESIAAAKICMQREKGDETCPLSFRILYDSDSSDAQNAKKVQQTSDSTFNSFPSHTFPTAPHLLPAHGTDPSLVDRDYESLTMMRRKFFSRLRQAEERKRLIDQIEAEDDNG